MIGHQNLFDRNVSCCFLLRSSPTKQLSTECVRWTLLSEGLYERVALCDWSKMVKWLTKGAVRGEPIGKNELGIATTLFSTSVDCYIIFIECCRIRFLLSSRFTMGLASSSRLLPAGTISTLCLSWMKRGKMFSPWHHIAVYTMPRSKNFIRQPAQDPLAISRRCTLPPLEKPP